jgi:hypothetical protein
VAVVIAAASAAQAAVGGVMASVSRFLDGADRANRTGTASQASLAGQ